MHGAVGGKVSNGKKSVGHSVFHGVVSFSGKLLKFTQKRYAYHVGGVPQYGADLSRYRHNYS